MTSGELESATPQAAVTAEGETFASDPRRLRYAPLEPPTAGHAVEVVSGVRWARIPLPIDLNHINVWLLDHDGGCVVVDTGMAAGMGKEAWLKIAAEVFPAKPLRGVFVTHVHPDHLGLARWLQDEFSAPVWMSERTSETARAMLEGANGAAFAEAEAFFRSHGVTELTQILPMFKPERFARMASGLPVVERYIADGDALDWSGGWRALETNGHAEGHLCLFSAGREALISGDQVLPTISSNISFNFRTSDPDPLGSYLSSLERLRQLPAATLVLPSHGAPFFGLQQRADDLIRHHRQQLALVHEACATPRTAADLLPLMFRRELKGMHLFLALGEALAHLERLVHEGRLERRTRAGVVTYSRAD